MSADEYVPDEQALEVAWIEFEASADDINAASAEFDRFLARVRRDAAREALDGFKAWRGTRQCPAISPPDPCNRPEGHDEPHAYDIPEGECDWREVDWSDTDTYRDTTYPEETP